MSGTDPKGRWFGSKGDPTEHFAPDGSNSGQTLPGNLPKIPGITLHYEIARGGMGVVYSGRQDFLDRRVAVKFLSVDLGGAAFAQRFQREAKILAGISHPNIVGCHMADTTPEGQSYLVMEFCDGPPLKSWIAENGPVAPLAAIRLIRDSARALSHAYQSDIIHRDVKPENILLETVTSTSLDIKFPFTPKIVDLGLARIAHEQVGEGLTSPGSVMGTPSTMSPEQFDDPDSVDFRSDIYGLGCCLYEMLVGQPAFTGTKLTDIVLRKRDACAPNPCDENPSLPAAVGAFTQRLLACSRDDRPASYKDLDAEADELMTVLLAHGAMAPAQEDDDLSGFMGQTIPSGPGSFPQAGTEPAIPQSAGTQPFQQKTDKPKQTSPGMLNTGELDFLSEGGPAGGSEPPPPAFQDSGTSGTSPTNPIGGGSPSGSKKGVYLGVGAAALVAVVLGVMFGMGDGKGEVNGSGDGNRGTNTEANKTNNNTGTSSPTAPTVAQIKMLVGGTESADSTVDLGDEFVLSVDVTGVEANTVDYKWTWPRRVMSPVSDTRTSRITFRLDDGLPGVEHTVQLEVRDANSSFPVKREYRVVVGTCPDEMPLIGFMMKPEWKVDKDDQGWIENMDPVDRHWRGRSLKDIRTLSTSLGREDYWEWHGNLLSQENRNESFATLGLRFEFGDKAYAVQLARLEAGKVWQLELLEAMRDGQQWRYRPLPEIYQVKWRPGQDDIDYRGWFSVQRRGDELIVQLAEASQPLRTVDNEMPPLKRDETVPRTIPVPANSSDVNLTLYVDNGIGRFRVLRR